MPRIRAETGATEPDPGVLEVAIRDRDVPLLVKWLFGVTVKLTKGQVKIIRAIAFAEHRRIVIKAPTRYGKTWCIALGLCLRFIFDRRALDARLLGPRIEQVEQLREYVIGFILASRHLRTQLEMRATGLERLKSEASRRKLTFKDGKSIWIQTASGDAFRLMGHGGDLIIIIEACLIDDDAWAKVLRMAGDDASEEDAVDETSGWIVKEGNPWHESNHFARAFKDPNYHVIDILLAQAISEGRIRPAFLEEQKRELSPIHYEVLYESRFPNAAEGQLIAGSWIDVAEKGKPPPDPSMGYSLDVARGGGDLSVLTSWLETPFFRYAEQQHVLDSGDTVKISKWAANLMVNGSDVVVDSNGIGAGVADNLFNGVQVAPGEPVKKFQVTFFIQAEKPDDPETYSNLKAEVFWKARKALEETRAGFNPVLRDLRAQLPGYRWSLDSRGKIRIDDPAGKSPDHGDSFVYRFAKRVGPKPRPVGVPRPDPLTRIRRL